MKRICVFAGSSLGVREDYHSAARDLGRALAARRIGLVYGGARVGLMGVVANAVLAADGEAIGVMPAALVAKEIAHERLTELRITKSMHERKATMAELSDAFVALPGGMGTWEELFEILTWTQLGLQRKPCGILNVAGYFNPLLTFIDHAVNEGFARPVHREMISVAAAPLPLLEQLRVWQAPVVKKWIDRGET